MTGQPVTEVNLLSQAVFVGGGTEQSLNQDTFKHMFLHMVSTGNCTKMLLQREPTAERAHAFLEMLISP